MKNLVKIGMISCGLFANLCLAGTAQFDNEKTTCFVFKNNKLVKKATCTYEGTTGGGTSGYAIFEATFDIKGYGKIDVVDNWSAKDDGKGNWKNEEITQTLNGKKAVQRYRHAKTYKILAKANSSNNTLTCFASKIQELCYVDNTPR